MATSNVRVLLHVIWATHRRMLLISPEIEPFVHHILTIRACQMKCPPLAVGGDRDHVHLVVPLHHRVTISELVGCIKGGSASAINRELDKEDPLRFPRFNWQRSYYARSVSPSSLELVIQYVRSHPERRELRPDGNPADAAGPTKHEHPPREREGRRVSL
jgi:putative transposase